MCVGTRYKIILVGISLYICGYTEHEGFQSKPTNDNALFTKALIFYIVIQLSKKNFKWFLFLLWQSDLLQSDELSHLKASSSLEWMVEVHGPVN